jgi:hypothetical protein
MITTHCPVCIEYEKLKAQYDNAKNRGYSQEQLNEFFLKAVKPFQCDKKYYLNAINQQGEIGILAISYKSFQAMKAVMIEQSQKGFDPTAKVGCFLNFKKIQAYKGDPQTNYSVEIATEEFADAQGNRFQRVKMHELTPDVINRLQTEAKDLNSLYKSLTPEQLEILVKTSAEERPKVFERFMGFGEPTQPTNQSPGVSVPNTNAQAVVTPHISGSNIEFAQFGQAPASKPVMPTPAPSQQPPKLADLPPWETQAPKQQAAPQLPPLMPSPSTSVPMGTSGISNNAKPVDVSQWSDDEFANAFMPK